MIDTVRLRWIPLCAAALFAAAAPAEAAAKKKASLPVRKAPAAEAPAAAEQPKVTGEADMKALLYQIDAAGGDKKRLKAYLKKRLARLKAIRDARKDFLEDEADTAMAFSRKLHDERELFEERMIKQTEDMFESLSSLDKPDRASALSDVERTQSSLLRLFELQQKQKTAEFFSARSKRWNEFAVKQEAGRLDFLAQAYYDWMATADKPKEKTVADSGSSQ